MKKISVRMLTQLAMLVALQFVLSKFCSISTDSLRIGFGFVPMAVCGILYGPFWTAAAYAAADILGGLIIYGSVNPFITLSVVITGLGYGLFLHRDNVRFFPHVAGAAAVSLFCSMVITTGTLAIMYGSTFWTQFVIRIPQGIGIAIAEPLLIPILYQLSCQLRKHGLVAAA